MNTNKSPGIGCVIITFPIPGFASVVGFAAERLSGDRVELPPGLASGTVQLLLFFFGQLLIRDKFFHIPSSSYDLLNSLYQIILKKPERIVNIRSIY
jgi:hypothetical protein